MTIENKKGFIAYRFHNSVAFQFPGDDSPTIYMDVTAAAHFVQSLSAIVIDIHTRKFTDSTLSTAHYDAGKDFTVDDSHSNGRI